MPTKKIRSLRRVLLQMKPHEQEQLCLTMQWSCKSLISFQKLKALYAFVASNAEMEGTRKVLVERLSLTSDRQLYHYTGLLNNCIEETLLLSDNITHNGTHDHLNQQRYLNRKKLLVGQLFSSTDRAKSGKPYLEEVKQNALHFGFYDLATCAQSHLASIASVAPNMAEWEEALASQTAHLGAKKGYTQVIHNFGFKGNRTAGNEQYRAFLKQTANQLQQHFEQTHAPIVGFYYYLLKIETHQLDKRYDKASEYCHFLVDIIRNNPSVYLQRRLGIAYINFSQNELYNYYFDYARGFAQQARALFDANSNNYRLALELEFYSEFYQGNTKAAGQLISGLLVGSKTTLSEFRKSWHSYLLANVFFVMSEHKRVHQTLHATNAIHKDKEGWNLAIRMLTIMNLIEMELFEHADQHISALYAWSKQGAASENIRLRDAHTVLLFKALRDAYYDFEEVAETKRELLELLSHPNTEYSWQVHTPELIPVHKWFEARLHRENYSPQFTYAEVNSISLLTDSH